jgi:hypothetical protein
MQDDESCEETWELGETLPPFPKLSLVMDIMLSQPGVQAVQPGRHALESRVVSQVRGSSGGERTIAQNHLPHQHQNLHQIPAPAPAQLWFGLYHTTPNLSLSVCAGTQQLTFVCMVSQDLEMFLPKSKSDDGYNILVRTGRQVQELHVVTALSRDELKKVLVAVTGQIAADLDA